MGAQIRLGYTSDAEGSTDKLSYDLWYLRHRSIAVNFWICVKTISVVLTGGRRTSAGEASTEIGSAATAKAPTSVPAPIRYSV